MLPILTLKEPFSSACQVTVVPLFVGSGTTETIVTLGALVSIVYDRVEDAAELLPALSDAAPAAIWIVSVPSVLGAPRLTVNV